MNSPPDVRMLTPLHSLIKSSTIGSKYGLIVSGGSCGPGIAPTIIIFCSLKRRDRGRFWTTKYITPAL